MDDVFNLVLTFIEKLQTTRLPASGGEKRGRSGALVTGDYLSSFCLFGVYWIP